MEIDRAMGFRRVINAEEGNTARAKRLLSSGTSEVDKSKQEKDGEALAPTVTAMSASRYHGRTLAGRNRNQQNNIADAKSKCLHTTKRSRD